jgi:gamma-glutamyltranspeptidase/glutathione hydrolase
MLLMRVRAAAVLALCIAGTGCATAGRQGGGDVVSGATIRATRGAVASVSGPASEAGRDVLMRGGNAVDAAIATAFALAVTFPEAGNIGGGGFMLIHPPRGKTPVVIDYRETAPAAATVDMFAGGNNSAERLVGVPGTVRGMALARDRYGKTPWKQLLAPAIKLAAEGFEVNQTLADSLNRVLEKPDEEAAEMRRVLGRPGGGAWQAGDRLVQSELAQTLQMIADGGPDAFYSGPIADSVVASLSNGGILKQGDLKNYQAKLRTPVHGTFLGYDIYASPPPSSGGIALIEMLNILETFDLPKRQRWSPETLHLIVETMRRAFLDRARHLGDPDFVPTPAHLTTKSYARQVAATIDRERATPSETLSPDIPIAPEGPLTTHFSVIDADGMAVSNTYTLERAYGGRIMVRGRGFLLNNEMGDFNPKPGVTDRLGNIGTPPNQVAPGKRMLSSMTPTIVTRKGKVVIVTGSPGSRTIINTVLCVVLNRLAFNMTPRESVDAPRMSHTWFPDRLAVEAGLTQDHARPLEALKARGHRIAEKPARQGDANSIFITPEGIIGVADQRHTGTAAGY